VGMPGFFTAQNHKVQGSNQFSPNNEKTGVDFWGYRVHHVWGGSAIGNNSFTGGKRPWKLRPGAELSKAYDRSVFKERKKTKL